MSLSGTKKSEVKAQEAQKKEWSDQMERAFVNQFKNYELEVVPAGLLRPAPDPTKSVRYRLVKKK